MNSFPSINKALDAFRAGKIVIVVDDESRENEGDLIMAAEFCTEEQMAFIIRHTGGVVCVPLSESIADKLELPDVTKRNNNRITPNNTVSVDAVEGITTGISAHDRTLTVHILASQSSTADDLQHPGHVFPLRAKNGGVLVRAGHPEATGDLCPISGLP